MREWDTWDTTASSFNYSLFCIMLTFALFMYWERILNIPSSCNYHKKYSRIIHISATELFCRMFTFPLFKLLHPHAATAQKMFKEVLAQMTGNLVMARKWPCHIHYAHCFKICGLAFCDPDIILHFISAQSSQVSHTIYSL